MSNEVQVCLNGHVIEEVIVLNSKTGQVTCPKCSSKAITACVECKAPVNARYVISPIAGAFNEWVVPASCEKCGKPHPWALSKLNAVLMLADEYDVITREEKKIYKKSVGELIKGGPEAELAAIQIKKILDKVSATTFKLFKDLIADALSETAKKSLGI